MICLVLSGATHRWCSIIQDALGACLTKLNDLLSQLITQSGGIFTNFVALKFCWLVTFNLLNALNIFNYQGTIQHTFSVDLVFSH